MALIEQHLPRQRNSFVHPFLAQRPHLTPSVPALLPGLAVPPIWGPSHQLGISCIRSHSGTPTIPLTLGVFKHHPTDFQHTPVYSWEYRTPSVPSDEAFPTEKRGSGSFPHGEAGAGSSVLVDTPRTQHHRPSLLPTTRRGQKNAKPKAPPNVIPLLN